MLRWVPRSSLFDDHESCCFRGPQPQAWVVLPSSPARQTCTEHAHANPPVPHSAGQALNLQHSISSCKRRRLLINVAHISSLSTPCTPPSRVPPMPKNGKRGPRQLIVFTYTANCSKQKIATLSCVSFHVSESLGAVPSLPALPSV